MRDNAQSEFDYSIQLPGVEKDMITFAKFISKKKDTFPSEKKDFSKFLFHMKLRPGLREMKKTNGEDQFPRCCFTVLKCLNKC